jgi:hypothetical protein
MNREPKSRKTGRFQSTHEAQTTPGGTPLPGPEVGPPIEREKVHRFGASPTMNRELGSRKIKGFQSNNEARATSLDGPRKSNPGVVFSRFIGGPASRFIGGSRSPRPIKSTRRTRRDAPTRARSWSTHRARKSPPIRRESNNEPRTRFEENQGIPVQ